MQALTSYSIHILTAFVSLTCTLGQLHNTNARHSSTTSKGKGSSHSQLLRLKNFSSKIRDLDHSSHDIRPNNIDYEGLEYLYYIPLHFRDYTIPHSQSGIPSKENGDHNILSKDRTKSTHFKSYSDDNRQSRYNIIIDSLSSSPRQSVENLSKINVLQQLAIIKKSLNKRLHFLNPITPSSTTEAPRILLSAHHPSNTLGSNTRYTTQSKHSLVLKRVLGIILNTVDKTRFGNLYGGHKKESNSIKGVNDDDSFSRNIGAVLGEDNNSGDNDYGDMDSDFSNNVHYNDDTDNKDGSARSVAVTGNESISKSVYQFHTTGKRDWKRRSRIMQYLRQRAGSVKGRKPLRLGGKLDRAHQASCRPDEDGSQPMRCPSEKNICLYDSLICDGKRDCSDGSDESFPVCVGRHWTQKILRTMKSMAKNTAT